MIYGYGLGSFGQGVSYYFMSAYFVIFLTNCVGLNSALAGAISSVALLVEVVAGMTIGNFSDRCTSKMGRRRPFMLAASIAMFPVLILIVHPIEASVALTCAYYLVLSVVFRIFFACYEIPYNAYGAEIATDYDERTRIRTISRIFSIAGNAVGYLMPLAILELFKNGNIAWQVMGMIMGVFCSLAWYISVKKTKNYGVFLTEKAERKKNLVREIFHNYRDLLKLKTMKLAITYKAAFSCAFSLFNVVSLYFLKYNLGLDNGTSSYMYMFIIFVFAVSTPLVDKMAITKGKAWQQMTTFALCGIAGIVICIIGPKSPVMCAVYVGLFALVQNSFWQLSQSIFYDIVEVDEYVNHKRREGDIMSMVSVLGTLISAVMIQLFGFFLNLAGFDAGRAVQSESVNTFLTVAYILVPCLCLLGGAVALKVFPITRKTFISLQTALELREKGESYDEYMEDIEKIVG